MWNFDISYKSELEALKNDAFISVSLLLYLSSPFEKPPEFFEKLSLPKKLAFDMGEECHLKPERSKVGLPNRRPLEMYL